MRLASVSTGVVGVVGEEIGLAFRKTNRWLLRGRFWFDTPHAASAGEKTSLHGFPEHFLTFTASVAGTGVIVLIPRIG